MPDAGRETARANDVRAHRYPEGAEPERRADVRSNARRQALGIDHGSPTLQGISTGASLPERLVRDTGHDGNESRGPTGGKRNDFVSLRLRSRPRSVSRDVARARVSWLINPKASGTSHLKCHEESDRTQGRPKHFAASTRPRNLRGRNWPKIKMSARARSILICRNGPSPQRRCLNGSKNRMRPI